MMRNRGNGNATAIESRPRSAPQSIARNIVAGTVSPHRARRSPGHHTRPQVEVSACRVDADASLTRWRAPQSEFLGASRLASSPPISNLRQCGGPRRRNLALHASVDFLIDTEVHRAIEMTPVVDFRSGHDEVLNVENRHLPPPPSHRPSPPVQRFVVRMPVADTRLRIPKVFVGT